MKRQLIVMLSAFALCLVAVQSALASFHTWDISEIYSNSDGSVQFVELVNGDFNNQDEFDGKVLTSGGNIFTFPSALSVGNATANRRLIVATAAYGSQPGSVPADFNTLPANFLDPTGDTINFAGFDTVVFTGSPTNGIDSLNYTGSNGSGLTTGPNSPTNLAGNVGSLVPEPSPVLLLLFGAAALGLRRRS